MNSLSCFKAYDIRGKVPEELNEDLAYKIGRAFVAELGAKSVVIGYDIRLESEGLAEALKHGLLDSGADVIDIGLCGTEEVYFNTFFLDADGGIMITASHNPKGYNGMKLVGKGAKPISGDSGLKAIERRVIEGAEELEILRYAQDDRGMAQDGGGIDQDDTSSVQDGSQAFGSEAFVSSKDDYIAHLLSYVDVSALKPLKLVMDAGNGSAGAVIRQIAERLPFECVLINETPDGNFPNGVPNPLLPEMRSITAQAVKENGADFGIAWDGDFDRCFLFDENGEFIEGYYLVGLLAETILAKNPGAKIIHDPRLTWNTIEQVSAAGGVSVQSKTGHAFIKERMRLEDAVYGGEMSAHHYFKEFAYCDSGMIPWLLIAELVSKTGKPLSKLVEERVAAFPCSGEINYKVTDVPSVLEKVMDHFAPLNPQVDKTDGVSLEFSNWRMNIRASNTEPLLRLNVESRGHKDLVWEKVKEIEGLFL